MGDVLAHLTIGARGPTGFEMQVGERRVPFGFGEARRLTENWPGQLARQAADRTGFQLTLGGQTVTLDDDEARQFAGLPGQLRWLIALADALAANRDRQEQAG